MDSYFVSGFTTLYHDSLQNPRSTDLSRMIDLIMPYIAEHQS